VRQGEEAIVKLVDAAVQSRQLQSELNQVWREQIADLASAVEIAALLKAEVAALPGLAGPPVEAEQDESGLAGSDILIMVGTWVATDIALKALADLGKDAVKDALRKLWVRHLKPALERRQRNQKALGDEIDAGQR
jgi:hypothetical protein